MMDLNVSASVCLLKFGVETLAVAHWTQPIGLFVLLFGENPQAVAYSAQPLCWSG